jgi:O-methyltransferase
MLINRYLDLVKSALVNELYVELEAQLLMSALCSAQGVVLDLEDFWSARTDYELLQQLLSAKAGGDTILLEVPGDGHTPVVDSNLRNYSEFSYTLVGYKRLNNLQHCIEDILKNEVPGDFLEAGVWRGGCCILMRAVLAAYDCQTRNVWLADSFKGLPLSVLPEDRHYDMDSSLLPILAVTVDEVKQNFRRFDLLDEQVRFLPGWFDESLKQSETGPLALLRVDCDLYSSTMTVLESLYGRVSKGGWVIIDDYGILPPCKQAVDEFRQRNEISAPLETIDDHGVCWQLDQ